MDRRELLSRITSFPLVSERLAEELLSGDFRSVFKGQGIEFDEVRHYERGDDVRSIDWNVSARFGTPYVKQFREEHELTVALVLDASASMHTGSGSFSRYDQALLSAALCAFSAERAGQKIAALYFDSGIRKIYPARKGRSHILALLLEGLDADVQAGGSALGKALAGTGRLLKRRSLILVFSDFLCMDWEWELARLSRDHDVIAVRISDPLDTEMPDLGLLQVRDPETGIELQAPSGFRSFRKAWEQRNNERTDAFMTFCKRHGTAYLEISTQDDPAAEFSRFFGRRRKA